MKNHYNVVIIGAGFAGLEAAKKLGKKNIDTLVVDRTNHHLFQPLLYQVATAALSPADIAVPIRSVLKNYSSVEVIMSNAERIDVLNKKVVLNDGEITFNYLIIATGARHSYFGKDKWEKYAPGLKTLNDALSIREKILFSLEEAEKIREPEKRKKYLTYVIVGGGPTGVEMAGAISEIIKKTIAKEFRNIKYHETKVILVEAMERILSAFDKDLSERAKKDLTELNVDVKIKTLVTDVNENGVKLNDEFIESLNIIWAAGNNASPLLKTLGTNLDKSGKVIVNNDYSIKEDSNIFVLGDAAAGKDKIGNPLPGTCPVAMQHGRYVANLIINSLPFDKRKPFNYIDKGSMATIGKARAIAQIGNIKLKGYLAWLSWCFLHIFYLIGFRNRFRVMAEWIWYYITFKRGIRLITKRTDMNFNI